MNDQASMVEKSLQTLKTIVNTKPGGEDRPQQRDMIRTICESVESDTPAMIEAGTGSGKSFAELIPAAFYANKDSRWVISTATIQLSEQIGKLDMPFLESHIPSLAGRWAVLKGRSNYLCLREFNKMKDLEKEAESALPGLGKTSRVLPAEAKETAEIMEWGEKTRTGERSEGPHTSDKTWASFSRTAATCPGASLCPFAENCFAEKASRRAANSDIVITNHALVAQDLLLKDKHVRSPLGSDIKVIVFDEVHELESYLSNAWGAELSEDVIKSWDTQLKRVLGAINAEERESFKKNLKASLNAAVTEGKKRKSSFIVEAGEKYPTIIQTHLNKVNDDFISLSLYSPRALEIKKAYQKIIVTIADTLHKLSDDSEGNVRWIEYDAMEWKKNSAPVASILSAPLMIGPILQDYTKNLGINTIFTSATIQVDGGFTVPAMKLGVSNSTGLALGSPFDFRSQGILGIPDFTAPKGKDRDKHFNEFKKLSLQIAKALKGRTLVLCTSKKNTVLMSEFLEKNGVNVVDTVSSQKSHASDSFKNDPSVVLVGTYGVWQGLDVQGDSCQAVLIEKIPFNRLDDVLASARANFWDSKGESGFLLESIAGAQTRLNQAVGRLIRSKTDKGIVVIADPRMKTTKYGKGLLKGLPPFYRLDDIDKLLESAENLGKKNKE